jgi:hypothetical protein
MEIGLSRSKRESVQKREAAEAPACARDHRQVTPHAQGEATAAERPASPSAWKSARNSLFGNLKCPSR